MDTTSSDSSSPPAPRPVKKENEEIKEFAETAMNELLGWYGYERLELRRWAARASSPEDTTVAKEKDECSWCGKSVADAGLRQGGAAFCSELCFSQSRRANFKRAKTCDWCRHVRHTVAYVEFQDGAVQLQFCSDKCLNQYKMHIFCRETQAHLDLNPHLVNTSSTSNLITPELWLKNCKSRSSSPHSEVTKSPTRIQDNTGETPQRKSPIPLLTVAPTSKLMRRKTSPDDKAQPKTPEPKKEVKTTKMNLRRRRTSKNSANVSPTIKSSNKAQDLRIRTPIDTSSQASTANSAVLSPPRTVNVPPSPSQNHNLFGFPSSTFMDDPRRPGPIITPNLYLPRMSYPTRPIIPMNRFPPPLPIPPPLVSQPPPVTVMVPYPVIIPVPLPIPIPLPITAFLPAYRKIKVEPKADVAEAPLDFTINGTRKDEDNETDTNFVDQSSKENQRDDLCSTETDLSPDKGNRVVDSALTKYKIARIGNKIPKTIENVAEPQESSRPLRKRRRLVEMSDDEDSMMVTTRKYVEV